MPPSDEATRLGSFRAGPLLEGYLCLPARLLEYVAAQLRATMRPRVLRSRVPPPTFGSSSARRLAGHASQSAHSDHGPGCPVTSALCRRGSRSHKFRWSISDDARSHGDRSAAVTAGDSRAAGGSGMSNRASKLIPRALALGMVLGLGILMPVGRADAAPPPPIVGEIAQSSGFVVDQQHFTADCNPNGTSTIDRRSVV